MSLSFYYNIMGSLSLLLEREPLTLLRFESFPASLVRLFFRFVRLPSSTIAPTLGCCASFRSIVHFRFGFLQARFVTLCGSTSMSPFSVDATMLMYFVVIVLQFLFIYFLFLVVISNFLDWFLWVLVSLCLCGMIFL